MPHPKAGEVWMVDLGLAAKARPCVLITNWPSDEELAMITVVAHTTTLRRIRWEHAVPKSFLQEGAFHLQQVQSVPIAKLMRRMGELTPAEFGAIKSKLRERFGL